MIGAVGHDDGVVRADREASRPGKASGFAPPHPELKQLPPLQQVMTPPTIAGIDRRERSIKLITRIPNLPAIVNHSGGEERKFLRLAITWSIVRLRANINVIRVVILHSRLSY